MFNTDAERSAAWTRLAVLVVANRQRVYKSGRNFGPQLNAPNALHTHEAWLAGASMVLGITEDEQESALAALEAQS